MISQKISKSRNNIIEMNEVYSNQINEKNSNENQITNDDGDDDDYDVDNDDDKNDGYCYGKKIDLPHRNLSINRHVSKEVQTRAIVSRVAKYYESYVAEMNLGKYFVTDLTVTSILPLQQRDIRYNKARWIVYGYVN